VRQGRAPKTAAVTNLAVGGNCFKTMRLLLILSFALTTSFCVGQETKFILRNESGFKEEFYVLKANKKIRHGTYVKYRQPLGQIVVIESGAYLNGDKHGLWEEYFNEISQKTWNAIREKGQYFNGKKNGVWTYYHLDTITHVTNLEKIGHNKRSESINLKIDQKDAKVRMAGMFLNDKRVGEWTTWNSDGVVVQKYNFTTGRLLFENSILDSTQWNINRKPIFVGGRSAFYYHAATNMRLTQTLEELNRDTIQATAAFNVDKYGKINSIAVIKNSGDKALGDELTRLILTTDLHWIPGIRDGSKSDYTMKLSYFIVRIELTAYSKQWRRYFNLIE
jgi:hypothetical protein